MTPTCNLTLTALSSIAHGGQTRGTITLLRRELVIQPEGSLLHVPIISGNSLRGRLRRIGEELLRDVLQYEGKIPASAAHALRAGGSLAKTSSEPLSGNRLKTLRDLIPQIGVFGAAGGGCIIDGALDVGKVVPHVRETNHITGANATLSTFQATQLESYTRQDDSDGHDFHDVCPSPVLLDPSGQPDLELLDADSSQYLTFRVETFPAGTRFSTWLRLRRPTPLEQAFFADVLTTFAAQGRIGGRSAIGHGTTTVHLDPPFPLPDPDPGWRATIRAARTEAIAALQTLT